jgi:hypothetical protein
MIMSINEIHLRYIANEEEANAIQLLPIKLYSIKVRRYPFTKPVLIYEKNSSKNVDPVYSKDKDSFMNNIGKKDKTDPFIFSNTTKVVKTVCFPTNMELTIGNTFSMGTYFVRIGG